MKARHGSAPFDPSIRDASSPVEAPLPVLSPVPASLRSSGNCACNIGAHAVGGLPQNAEGRLGNLRELLRQRVNIGIFRMMLGQVAQEDSPPACY